MLRHLNPNPVAAEGKNGLPNPEHRPGSGWSDPLNLRRAGKDGVWRQSWAATLSIDPKNSGQTAVENLFSSGEIAQLTPNRPPRFAISGANHG